MDELLWLPNQKTYTLLLAFLLRWHQNPIRYDQGRKINVYMKAFPGELLLTCYVALVDYFCKANGKKLSINF